MGHRVYPYLLRSMRITRPNQVWAADITYVPMARGFMYLVAIMDWHSRCVLAWRLSNTLDVDFCVKALEEALEKGKPEIFNTDQGSQFTSEAFHWAFETARYPDQHGWEGENPRGGIHIWRWRKRGNITNDIRDQHRGLKVAVQDLILASNLSSYD